MFKIWERYFLRETIKMVFFIIFCFYGLYILIDYTSHSSAQNYHHTHFQWKELFLCYYYEFIQRLNVLLPFALGIATIRTLTQLNVHNELLALMAGGIKLKTLLRPFILLGLASVFITYVNTEYLIPKALNELRHLHDTHALQKNKRNQHLFVQNLTLKDHSTLLFQDYDTSHKRFFDAYWIKSYDEIYRIKYLSPHTTPPTGTYVDHLARNNRGQFVKKASHKEKGFPDLRFNKKVLIETITPPEELSLSKLWGKLPNSKGVHNEKEAIISATFFQKMVVPWLCMIAIIAPAPFCIRFSRYFPVFFIYAFSLFGLVACYLVIDAAVVLVSRQILSATWGIGAPFLLLFGTVIVKFAKIK